MRAQQGGNGTIVGSSSTIRSPRPLRWLAVAAALAVLLAGAWFLVTRGGEMSLSLPGRAASLLTAIEAEAALPVRDRGPVERDGPDGPMPEIAGRKLVIASDAATIVSRVRRGCEVLGLAPAGAERRAIEPDAICEGRWRGGAASVHLTTRCGAECTVHLQTQDVGF